MAKRENGGGTIRKVKGANGVVWLYMVKMLL